MHLFESESECEDDKSDEQCGESSDKDDAISFDTFTESGKTEGERWSLKSGEKVKDLLIRVISRVSNKQRKYKCNPREKNKKN